MVRRPLIRIGELEIGHQRVVQYAAAVRVHRNVPGRAALGRDSYSLEMPQGISVFDEGDAPRLPLIGLRKIVANKLRLVIDGDRLGSATGDAEDDGVALQFLDASLFPRPLVSSRGIQESVADHQSNERILVMSPFLDRKRPLDVG
jgi:hypothetical protein